ncbi:metallophosphoesterase family protein [Phycisphaera mikurensis]|uniref:Calcineurin-like phosphoesterase domain-containing protein n=1 Tax=Phycisphaera mikurensis (strain NBRC 102666 / KCTC 22515 / FYK2301M01) TaxID=1142394 RepID=I0ID35_PHYMF|nr:metallophosphoesterase [Phycisphaera mikurensis]MBB6442298.1 3',5'-cyclic AMP phosphodiesterase CpdA [Phycisphaera mikurensis]BAM03173.1 hypothetical protein PSMK_10140 [Phycisphaera mikurensis NBRC 102666]
MRLALLGDVHFFELRMAPRRLLSKRAMGHANLVLNRRKKFAHERLPALLEHLRAQKPDRLLMSGDVTTSSLEAEFARVRTALATLDDAEHAIQTVLVPGNHDAYTFRSHRTSRMRTLLADVVPPSFPHNEPLGDRWELLALDSAVPNRIFSRGRLGAEQFAATRTVIERKRAGEGLVILCHYPCVVPRGTPSGWSHDLKEAAELRELLQASPAEIVFVHGHVHKPWFIGGPRGLRPGVRILNCGSPCMLGPRYPAGQGYWTMDLPADPTRPLNATHHVPQAGGGFASTEHAATPGRP